MKKLPMVAALLLMVLAASVPAVAQPGQGFDQESESGDVEMSFEASNSGSSSNVCAPALQFGNTGNLQNEQGVPQLVPLDEIEFSAEDQMVFEPSLETDCAQDVQQASAASSGG